MKYPNEPSWMRFGSAGEWATDGVVIVRKGTPMPTEAHGSDEDGDRETPYPWKVETIDVASGVLGVLERASVAEDDASSLRFHARLRPIFEGAERVRMCPSGLPGAGSVRPCAVWRDGQLAAVVMPLHPYALRPSFGVIDASGRDCAWEVSRG